MKENPKTPQYPGLDYAESLIKSGFGLIFLYGWGGKKVEKNPVGEYFVNGFQSALYDFDEYKRLWKGPHRFQVPAGKDFFIGLCPLRSNLLVIDFDTYNMTEEQSRHWEVKKLGWLDDGHVIQNSLSGGFHLFVRRPEELEFLTQHQNYEIFQSLGRPSHIDIRNTAGYVGLYEAIDLQSRKDIPYDLYAELIKHDPNRTEPKSEEHGRLVISPLIQWAIDNKLTAGKRFGKDGNINFHACPREEQHESMKGEKEKTKEGAFRATSELFERRMQGIKVKYYKTAFYCHHASCSQVKNEEFHELFYKMGAPREENPTEYSFERFKSGLISPGQDHELKQRRWIWENHIPRGKFTILAGDSDVGKTTLLCDIASRVSRGDSAPDGSQMDQGRVLYLTNEDDRDEIDKKFIVANANFSNIDIHADILNFSIGKKFQFLEFVRGIKEEESYDLIIIDSITPIGSHVQNSNNQNQMRAAIETLPGMVQDTKIAIVGLLHSKKESKDTKEFHLKERVSGSKEWTNLSRSVLFVAESRQAPGTMAFGSCKLNAGRNVGSGVYRIMTRKVDEKYMAPGENPDDVSFIEWMQWDKEIRMFPDRVAQIEKKPEEQKPEEMIAELIERTVERSEDKQISLQECIELIDSSGIVKGNTFRQTYHGKQKLTQHFVNVKYSGKRGSKNSFYVWREPEF